MDLVDGRGRTFLRADEVDEPETTELDLIVRNSPGSPTKSDTDTVEQQNLPLQGTSNNFRQDGVDIRIRPPLRRGKWAPVPQQPPPRAPPQPVSDLDNPTDSLSLAQLKKLVTEMPRVEPAPYAFVYEESASFEEELEELFGYTAEERSSLLKLRSTFARRWQAFNRIMDNETSSHEGASVDWRAAEGWVREDFLKEIKAELEGNTEECKSASLECLLYIALGCWHECAGLVGQEVGEPAKAGRQDAAGQLSEHAECQLQISCIKANLHGICNIIGAEVVFDAMRAACLRDFDPDNMKSVGVHDPIEDFEDEFRREKWASVILMYLIVDRARRDEIENTESALPARIVKFAPKLLNFLTDLLADLRWDDTHHLPHSKILLLYWKTLHITLGGLTEIHQIKNAFAQADPDGSNKDGQPLITASPLDYYLFRQDITSKYPAFDPPPPLFAFEPENNSMLPPLQDFTGKVRQSTKSSSGAGPASINGNGASIIHQPVHIATPVPSPPPSPAGPGGKGIKKQNYQTNQLFPFLYPPLDESTNDLGGKGSTELQDLLVGRKWQGSDIPASILEAADLFAKRMRATRVMKQLWKERIRFMKYERGYGALSVQESIHAGDNNEDTKHDVNGEDAGLLDEDLHRRMVAVEDFYKHALPRLQSVVIVLLKVLLQTVTTLVTQPNGAGGLQNGLNSPDLNGQAKTEVHGDTGGKQEKSTGTTIQELDIIRSQEIMGKAVSGIFILLLKWFKLSHILKFEYLAQLLLDSNYIQLVLKLFTHQELELVVAYKCERKSLNFFRFCQLHSRHGASPTSPSQLPDDSDSDSTSPSAMKPDRSSNPDSISSDNNISYSPALSLTPPPPPEVDELGYPSTDSFPTGPITHFSWRNFFSSINNLRIIQKIVKSKPHRQLLMVQYKSSNILKKALKVPQPDIRLYTLKIIKGQVPYCHRKWRQGNMRIITAIYLHCKPSLRDEWLAGVDVEGEVGEALPGETALRSLTYWYNLRRYPEEMGMAGGGGRGEVGDGARGDGGVGGMLDEERDFFVSELEKMEVPVENESGEPEELQNEQRGEEFVQMDGY